MVMLVLLSQCCPLFRGCVARKSESSRKINLEPMKLNQKGEDGNLAGLIQDKSQLEILTIPWLIPLKAFQTRPIDSLRKDAIYSDVFRVPINGMTYDWQLHLRENHHTRDTVIEPVNVSTATIVGSAGLPTLPNLTWHLNIIKAPPPSSSLSSSLMESLQNPIYEKGSSNAGNVRSELVEYVHRQLKPPRNSSSDPHTITSDTSCSSSCVHDESECPKNSLHHADYIRIHGQIYLSRRQYTPENVIDAMINEASGEQKLPKSSGWWAPNSNSLGEMFTMQGRKFWTKIYGELEECDHTDLVFRFPSCPSHDDDDSENGRTQKRGELHAHIILFSAISPFIKRKIDLIESRRKTRYENTSIDDDDVDDKVHRKRVRLNVKCSRANPACMHEIIYWVYHGCSGGRFSPTFERTAGESYGQLLYAAKRLELPTAFKMNVQKVMVGKLDHRNRFEMLEAANIHDLKLIKNMILTSVGHNVGFLKRKLRDRIEDRRRKKLEIEDRRRKEEIGADVIPNVAENNRRRRSSRRHDDAGRPHFPLMTSTPRKNDDDFDEDYDDEKKPTIRL